MTGPATFYDLHGRFARKEYPVDSVSLRGFWRFSCSIKGHASFFFQLAHLTFNLEGRVELLAVREAANWN